MAKTITFTFEKTAYTLEFTRETVMMLEQAGLTRKDVENIDEAPINTVMKLFTGAFVAHHKKAASINGLVERIWNTIPNKTELTKKLIEMYLEPAAALFEDPEDEKGKTVWTVNE
jgi:hypothetical protein